MEETRDIAVEARTLAAQAHNRINGHEDALEKFRDELVLIREAVARLNVKVAIWSAAGSLLGGGAIAAVVSLIPH